MQHMYGGTWDIHVTYTRDTGEPGTYVIHWGIWDIHDCTMGQQGTWTHMTREQTYKSIRTEKENHNQEPNVRGHGLA